MSLNLPTLQALLSRVEGGEGEDRALDAEIALHIGGCVRYRNWYDDDAKTQHAWHCKWQNDSEWEPLPHFTTSLDAAVALVERVRPGMGASVLQVALLRTPRDATIDQIARAVLAVMIGAQIAEMEAGDDAR
jgi:hypothetical protein